MWKIGNSSNKDLKEIYNYDSYKSKLWQGEFEFVGRKSFSGERFRIELKDIALRKCLMGQYLGFIDFNILYIFIFS